jgi:hypothetical protein
MAVLRPAQALRVHGRIERCPRAVRPCEQPLRRLEIRPLLRWRDRQQAAFALDHHPSGLAERPGYQRDPCAAIGLGYFAHPFGAGAGFTEAAPGHHQPGVPAVRRRHLPVVRPQAPMALQRSLLALA